MDSPVQSTSHDMWQSERNIVVVETVSQMACFERATSALLTIIDDFHTTFSTSEGDGMYVTPESRPKIW